MVDPTEDSYRLLTLDLVVRSDHHEMARAIRWHLAPFHRPATGEPAVVVEIAVGADGDLRYIRDEIEERRGPPRRILRHALWDIQGLVPERVRGFVFLHAGAVVHQGRALLLAGDMESGKSVLTAALLQRGYRYLSDEFGVIDMHTRKAHPFEKRIVLGPPALEFLPGVEPRLRDRVALSAELPDRYAEAEDLGATVAGPAPVGRVVLLGAQREGRPRLIPLGKAEAAVEMARQCMNLTMARQEGVVVLAQVAGEAEAFRIEGGSPGERADLIAAR